MVFNKLFEKGVSTVITTLGKNGYEIATLESASKYPCIEVKVVDTTAAGDTASGGLCVGLSKGQDLKEAMAFGSVAASLACTKRGAQCSVPSPEEIKKYI